MCATFARSPDDRKFPANSIFNEVKAYMEKQQSVIDRLTEMMATMKKETSDPQVCVTSKHSAKVALPSLICQFLFLFLTEYIARTF